MTGSRTLPRDVTSHDLLKAAAILFMFIDHAGYYFYPEDAWLRVLGRFSAPVWFFLIGYAHARTVQLGIWVGALLVAVTWAVSGQYLFPANILFSLAFARLALDGLMLRALKDKQSLWGTLTILLFLSFPSVMAFEYGTLGFMFAMAGFLVRHRENLSIPRWVVATFMTASAVSIAAVQVLMMPPLTFEQLMVLFGGMGVLGAALYSFKSKTFPLLTAALGPFAHLVRFMGRHSLEIYVVHLMIIAAVVTVLYPERFGLFAFEIAPPAVLQFFK